MANQRPLTNDEGAVFDLIDDENPEWTDEMFARAVPFSGLPQELQTLLSGEKHIKPDAKIPSKRQPAA